MQFSENSEKGEQSTDAEVDASTKKEQEFAAELNTSGETKTEDNAEPESEPEPEQAAEDVSEQVNELETNQEEAPVSEDGVEQEPDPYREFRRELRSLPGKWYVVHSYGGYERRVKQNIDTRKLSLAGGDSIFQIEVPMEESIEIKNGQRKLVSKVRVPSYVFVRMDMNEESWALVRHTPAVTGFVGNSQNPTPLRPAEAFDMLKSLFTPEEPEVEQPKSGKPVKGQPTQKSVPIKIDFEIGESILIKDGSFAGLPGTISEIKPDSGKVTVLVSLFERETPVELSFNQVGPLN